MSLDTTEESTEGVATHPQRTLGVVFIADGKPPVDARAVRSLATIMSAIPGWASRVESIETEGRSVETLLSKLSRDGIRDVVLLPLTDASESRAAGLRSARLRPSSWSRTKMGRRSLDIYLGDSIFGSGSIPLLAFDRVLQALARRSPGDGRSEATEADEIYSQSFNKVRALVGPHLAGRPELEQELIVRVVHASADPDLAGRVSYSADAIDSGLGAISSGADIIVDTEMVRAGLYNPALKAFGCNVKCYLYDERIQGLAAKKGTTKTAAAVELAVEDGMDGDVAVVGNAPTALVELVKAVKAGRAAPALVVGVPCGFVNASESKELLIGAGIPYITVRGAKGGSAVAASITNFLAGAAAARGRRRR